MGNNRASAWRGMGAILGTKPGAQIWKAARGAVNQVAAFSTPDLTKDIPWTDGTGSLPGAKVSIVTTSGLYLEGDEPFDIDALAGDTSFRVLPRDLDAAAVRVAHAHYPHRYVEADLNVLLPIDHVRRLEAEGIVRLGPRMYSFGYGGQQVRGYVDPENGTAHQVASMLKADGVDIALLVPA